jgi:hypothetical protein
VKVLLDVCTPVQVRKALPGHVVHTAASLGWAGLSNGDLLRAAERAGYELFIICDKNLRHQQNLSGRKLRILELWTNPALVPPGANTKKPQEKIPRIWGLNVQPSSQKHSPLVVALRCFPLSVFLKTVLGKSAVGVISDRGKYVTSTLGTFEGIEGQVAVEFFFGQGFRPGLFSQVSGKTLHRESKPR